MLTDDDIREQVSLAYIHAVASHAGFAWERTSIDRDGVDGRVLARGFIEPNATLKSPLIGLQLKATSTIIGDADPIVFPLKQKNYDDLRGRFAEPRYLALLLLPSASSDWLRLDTEALVLRRCMYWCSLRNAEETTNTTSTTVYVPRTQVLDVAALRGLMQAAAREEAL